MISLLNTHIHLNKFYRKQSIPYKTYSLMLTNLKKNAFHLLLLMVLATMHVHCSRKQTATTASTSSTNPETSTNQIASTATDLQKYAGRYDVQSDEISWAEVTVENNKLYGASEGKLKTELIKESEDKFKVQGLDATITFTRDSQQQVNGLVISYQGYEIKGEKVK